MILTDEQRNTVAATVHACNAATKYTGHANPYPAVRMSHRSWEILRDLLTQLYHEKPEPPK